MKKIIFFPVLATIFLLSQVSPVSADYKKYRKKSGRIVYKISGVMKGNSTYYWDDYGYRAAAYTEGRVKVLGIEKDIVTADLIIGRHRYRINDGEIGDKKDNEYYQDWLKHKSTSPEELAENHMIDEGYTKLKKRKKVCGHHCDIWEKKGIEVYLYKGYMLKLTGKRLGVSFVLTATKLEEGYKPDKELFKLPKEKD